jgi:uncharacterized protein (TIGR04255 family)
MRPMGSVSWVSELRRSAMAKDLKNKPLIEAIMELKWELQSTELGEIDPHYKFLLGKLFDRVRNDYGELETLPTSNIPDILSGHMIQHRFRSSPNGWPLIQVGPGIMSVNETDKYKWVDFSQRSVDAVDYLFESHPAPKTIKVESLLLRYIDAIEFDYSTKDITTFLKENLKINVILPSNLFNGVPIDPLPRYFRWESSFRSSKPKSNIVIRFTTGQKSERPALIWETLVQSTGGDVPAMPSDFSRWLHDAHELIRDWFFKLIEGDLERRFSHD